MRVQIAALAAALLSLAVTAQTDEKRVLRRKRLTAPNNDGDTSFGASAWSKLLFSRDLNVVQDSKGSLDSDEDFDGYFFTSPSMSMSLPPTSTPVDDIYKPVTRKNLDEYCEDEYRVPRSTTSAVPDKDSFDWYCQINDDDKEDVSMKEVCKWKYGSSYREVLLEGNKNGWACVDWTDDDASYIIVPVLIIARDYRTDSNDIADAIASVQATVERVQSWYRRKMSSNKTFRLSRPILKLSGKSAKKWNELSCLTAEKDDRPKECKNQSSGNDRFGYFREAKEEAEKTSLPSWPIGGTKQISPVFVYTGPDSEAFWLGAAATQDGQFSVNPPNVAVCPVNSADCGLYSVGHELGHNFDLVHSCEIVREPKCYDGIMQNPGSRVLQSVLFSKEQKILKASPYFD